jgi:hypothetical protein
LEREGGPASTEGQWLAGDKFESTGLGASHGVAECKLVAEFEAQCLLGVGHDLASRDGVPILARISRARPRT